MRKLAALLALLAFAIPASAGRLPIVAGQDLWPVYAPDGEHVAFTVAYNRTFELDVVDLKTRKVSRIGSGLGQPTPTWSSDDRIAWSSGGVLYTANPDGSAKKRYIAPQPSYGPAWRPKSEEIAYLTHARATNLDLWVAGQVWATNAIGQPVWSPDGAQLAFRRDDGIYVATAPNVERKVASVANPGGLAWSRDGTRIAYLVRGGVYVVESAGGPSALETRNVPPTALAPSWSVDDVRVDADRVWSPVDNSWIGSGPRAGCPGHTVLLANGKTAVSGSCVIRGTAAADVIQGTESWGDVILGGAGNDQIHAGDRHTDRIDCGPGRDTVWADKLDKLSHCEIVH